MVPNESIGGFSRRPMITIRPLPAIAAICALLILAIPELNRRDTHSAGVTRARRVYTIAGQGENTSAQEQLLHAPTRRLGDVQLTLGRARERVRTGELARGCGRNDRPGTIRAAPQIISLAMARWTLAPVRLVSD